MLLTFLQQTLRYVEDLHSVGEYCSSFEEPCGITWVIPYSICSNLKMDTAYHVCDE